MAFTEDLDVFFDEQDFAIGATLTISGVSKQISIIFDATTQNVNLYDVSVEANTPQFQCKSDDLVGIKTKRDTVLINSKTYTIERIEPDGTGVSTVYLK